MKSQSIDYFDGSQKLVGEFIYPDFSDSKPKPTVIVFHAFEGRGEFAVDYAKKLAEKGYIAFVADMYGDGKTTHDLAKCIEWVMPLVNDRATVRRRAVLAFETVANNPQVDKNKISAVGFCLGGMCVLEVARSGANLYAGISVHGVFMKSDLPTHLIKGKLLLLHGYKDPQVPPTALSGFAKEMEEVQVKDWTFVFFGNAEHSFSDAKTGTFDPEKEKAMGRKYDPIAAERSFHYVVDFIR